MARTIETEGGTVEEAIQTALSELGVDRSQVEIETLEEEKKGFFGRGGGKARVRATIAEDEHMAETEKSEKQSDADRSQNESGLDKAVALIADIMHTSHVSGDIVVVEGEDVVQINISGSDPGVLIGKHGETLAAIQTIVNVVLKKAGTDKKVIIDVEGYRQRRAEALTETARIAATKALRMGRAVALEPMNSYDRRMVHLALQDNDQVHTVSEGEEPSRQVVITPKV
ncbi:MAG TPA: RNA-binding cell elongation regulator Jag/EloR [Candidatus Aquicultor sp.]|jgi:spoIIIJ-associated protein